MSWADPLHVAVSQRVVIDPTHGERRDGLAHDWVDAFRRLQILPQLIPNDPEIVGEILVQQRIDAVLLTGGNDIVRPGCKVDEDAAPERDATERRLIEYARAAEIPLVGICRGAQMIHLMFDGRLVEDTLPREHAGTRHGVELSWGDRHERVDVNSFHRWLVPAGEMHADLQVVGRASGGSAELFTHRHEQLVGILWHPEREGPATMPADAFLRGLLEGRSVFECLEDSVDGAEVFTP